MSSVHRSMLRRGPIKMTISYQLLNNKIGSPSQIVKGHNVRFWKFEQGRRQGRAEGDLVAKKSRTSDFVPAFEKVQFLPFETLATTLEWLPNLPKFFETR